MKAPKVAKAHKSRKSQPGALAKYIRSIGLPLTARQDELFEIEARPMINAASTVREKFELEGGWRVVTGTRTGDQRVYQKGKIILAKERVLKAVLWQLRGMEYVAVARREINGKRRAAEIVAPQRWQYLTMTWGSGSVSGNGLVLHDVYVARADRLGKAQHQEVSDYLFKVSAKEPHDGEAGRHAGGRPRSVGLAVVAWIAERQASAREMPADREAGRAQALTRFEKEIDKGEISPRTIYREVDKFYSDKDKLARRQN